MARHLPSAKRLSRVRDSGDLGKVRFHVPAGRRLILKAPGGGGFGPASERPEDARAADRLAGYVSKEK